MTMQLDERAREILRANDRGGYTVPNGRVYPFQWNWDSAFVALGFATFDQDRAWREIETLFEAQWPDGFLPHIVFWKDDAGYFPGPAVWGTGTSPLTSGITQPPVASSVIRSLWLRAERSAAFRPRLERLFSKLFAWHRWFAQVRDPLGKGVVLAVHPWETGRENSPEWDAPSQAIDTSRVGEYKRRDTTHLDQSMRPTKAEYDRYLALVQAGREMGWDQRRIAREHPFRVADVGMTMLLLRANRDLAALADDLGRKAEAAELRSYIARAEAGIGYLWDDRIGAYCSRDSINGYGSATLSVAGVICVPLAGFLAHRLAARTPLAVFYVLAIGLVLAGLLLLPLQFVTSAFAVGAVLFASGAGKGLFDGCIYAAMHDVVPPATRATAVGLMTLVGFCGAGLAPIGVAQVSGWIGMAPAMTSLAFLYLAAAILLVATRSSTLRSILETREIEDRR